MRLPHAIAAASIDADDARRNAREILRGGRFQPEKVPRPFAGLLRWIGDQLAPIGRFFAPVVEPIGAFFTSGVGLALLGVLLVVGIALVARTLARRRLGALERSDRHLDDLDAIGLDPDDLDRAADTAERDGELELAIRLRFRAGLLRLDEAGVISFRPSLTSGQVARRLHTPTFDDLARTFDAVAYGGRDATPPDVEAARRGWGRVLTEARSR